ncbi:hypothetical protein CISIN_1g0391281mg, partial [Citrus sinensis]
TGQFCLALKLYLTITWMLLYAAYRLLDRDEDKICHPSFVDFSKRFEDDEGMAGKSSRFDSLIVETQAMHGGEHVSQRLFAVQELAR